MKHNKIISLGAVAVALAAVIGLASTSLAASANSSSQSANNNKIANWQAKHQELGAKRQAVDTALANNDYQAWLTAVGSACDKAKLITSDKFPQLVQAYQLEQEGKEKFDQARAIREQLGLKGPEQGKRSGKGPGTASHDASRAFFQPAESN